MNAYRQQALRELKPSIVAGHGQTVVGAHQLPTAEDVFPANVVGYISVARVNVTQTLPSSSQMLPASATCNYATKEHTVCFRAVLYIATQSQISKHLLYYMAE